MRLVHLQAMIGRVEAAPRTAREGDSGPPEMGLMMPHIIGEGLFARDGDGRLCTRIATAFPRANTIVTLCGIHATQRMAFVDAFNCDRAAAGLAPLTEGQEEEQWLGGVDLVLEDDAVLIRPDPNDMPLAFEADELLQQIVSKKKIQFLYVSDERVRDAIKQRGECWRISPLPRSPQEMKRMIETSRIAIGGDEIYYYNKSSGTRLLTYDRFCRLDSLVDEQLAAHLSEIQQYCSRTNRLGNPEVAFFSPESDALARKFAAGDFTSMDHSRLRSAYESLRRQFRDVTAPELRQDDIDSAPWRSRMYAALIGQTDKAISEEVLLGLSAEFFMQVEWVPGGRIEDGELLLDSVFEEEDGADCGPPGGRVCDHAARGFLFNLIRDYGDLESINVGRVVGSLSHRQGYEGRRGVYVAEIKQRGNELPILRIIRMQKWGVREHLDEGKDLLTAILEAEDYTEYILDRRLGCRQLGMHLSPRTTARKVHEPYTGRNTRHHGAMIWSAYFERDYIPGVATDKIPSCRFADEQFAIRFARLLGAAAAPNLIVGRRDLQGKVIFDDGDELVVEDAVGLPVDILVADHTGTFTDYQRDLMDAAPSYAAAIAGRASFVPDPRAFAEGFFNAFIERFGHIQQEYKKRRRAFDSLFKHKRRDEKGSFAYRWERILARLEASDPRQLAAHMRRSLEARQAVAVRA